MARKRLKVRADFSVMIKFPEEMRWLATKFVEFGKKVASSVRITEQLPSDGQRYVVVLLEIGDRKR